MVKGAALGWDVAALAAWSGRTARTVRRWLAAFRAGGVSALADAPHPGRPRRADDAYLAALERATDTPPRDLGLAFDVWTSARLSAYLAQTTGTEIAPGWLRVVLGRRRFACGRPKHSVAHLQDPAEVAACEERLAQAGKKGGAGAAPLRTAL
jgi:transposase